MLSSSSYSQNFEIYVSDAGNFNNPPWQILKFDGNGQNPSVFINNNLSWPIDIPVWDASDTPKGIYIPTVQYKGNLVANQKIIVQK